MLSQVESEGLSKAESTTMLCESAVSGPVEDPQSLNVNDLELLCDLFYLPCEHGPKVSNLFVLFILLHWFSPGLPCPQSLDVLSEFYWLKTHAGCMLLDGHKDADLATEVIESF